MQISNDNGSAVVIVHLAYYIYSLFLSPPLPLPSRLVHTVSKKHQIRNLRVCVRVRCAVTIVSKWPPRSLTITDARPHIDARHDKLCMHIYATNADARTHLRTHVHTHVCRGELARRGVSAMANLYLHPRISTRSRNLTAPPDFRHSGGICRPCPGLGTDTCRP